jgi:hypothetical protein
LSKRTLVSLGLLVGAAFAGPKFTFDDATRSLEIQQAYQVWSALTWDPQRLPEADARADVFVRRARLTFKGAAWKNLDYQFGFAADNLGKDSLTGVGGTAQIPAVTTFQTIDAAVWYHLPNDLFVLAGGLMTPHLNRELFASFTNVPSLDQAATYSYVRDHLTTRNSARETGLALAGVWYDTTSKWGVSADMGAYDNSWDRSATTATPTVGAKWSPLFAGRLALNLGDRENKGWVLSSNNSTRAKGWGASLGVFGAWKGETETKAVKKDSTGTGTAKTYTYTWQGGSESSDVWGADAFVWAFGVTVQGEWVELGTSFSDSVVRAMSKTFKQSDIADHAINLRVSYILPFELGGKFEPVVGWSWFEADDASPRYNGGRDETVDVGLNWLLDGNKTKLSLHYLNNNGSASTAYMASIAKSGAYSRRSDSYVLGLQIQL